MDDSDLLMSLADIAEMAGVTRPAASNWRRRNEDFPKPVEETGATSLFRSSDVRAWMTKHHKRLDGRSVEQLVWSAVNPERAVMRPEEAARAGIMLLGYTALARRRDTALAAAIRAAIEAEDRDALRTLLSPLNDQARLLGIEEGSAGWGIATLPSGTGPFLVTLLDLAAKYGAGEVCDALVTAIGRGSRGEGEHTTPHGVANLIMALAGPPRGVVIDSACGYGGLLLAARQISGDEVTLIGQDMSADACQVARLRMLAHGAPAAIAKGDSLALASGHAHAAAIDTVEADLVLADPSPGTGQEMMWLRDGIGRLRAGGTAIFVLGNAAGFRGGADGEARRQLLTSGSIRAIIALPAALYPTTSMPVSLWITTRPRQTGTPDPDPRVLFMDASALGRRRGKSRTELLQADIATILACFQRWESSGRASASLGVRAAAVPVKRIMDAGGDLSAARWVEPPGPAPQEVLRRIDQAALDLQSAQAAVSRFAVRGPMLAVAADGSRRQATRKVSELADVLQAKRPSLEWIGAGDVPYIRPQDVGPGMTISPAGRVNLTGSRDRAVITHPHDIVVASDGARLRAAADLTGGSAVSAPLQIVRPFPGAVDPLVLAALISGRSTSIPLADLEVPNPDPDLAGQLGRMLKELDEQRRRTTAVIEALDRLGSGLMEALNSPAIRLSGR